MSFYGLLRELEKINRAAEREQARRERINARNQEIYRRNLEKQRKADHMISQQKKADDLTKKIIDQYTDYDKFKDKILSYPKFFRFDDFKKKTIKKKFVYNVPMPQKSSNSSQIKVPKESKLEQKLTFLRKRRLSIENKKQEMELKETQQYNDLLKKYESNKAKALKKFELEQFKLNAEIDEFNKSVDNWKSGCANYDKESIDKYLAHLLNFFINNTNDKLVSKVRYDYIDNKLIYEVFLKKENELFPCEGYRYYKQKDSIEPIITKKTTINTILKELIPNVAITLIDILFKNDELDLFNEIIVNVYYTRKCCSSIKLLKDEYKSFNLNEEDDYYYVYDHYMKNYKTLTTGVKPYDSMYVELV
ncbi:MAG: hypothetical protein ACI4XM_07930 [Candidatus Coprovivens sp.]